MEQEQEQEQEQERGVVDNTCKYELRISKSPRRES